MDSYNTENTDPNEIKGSDKNLIQEALDQVQFSEEYWDNNRKEALAEIEFVFAKDQWDAVVKSDRGNRPCLNANDLPIFLDQIVAAHRLNRGAINAIPVDSDTDPLKAEVVGGLIRQIEKDFYAYVAYDEALEFVSAGGYAGAIRVITEYENDDLFNSKGELKRKYRNDPYSAFFQKIGIIPVENQLNVLYDPSAKLWHTNDGYFLYYFDDINVDVFESQYPKARLIDFETEIPEGLSKWANQADKTIRVAEWFRKESIGSKEVFIVMNDGIEDSDEEVLLMDKAPENKDLILESREIEDFKIVWRKISGYEVLEGPTTIPGRLWPIIPVWGKKVNINGEKTYRGMFRYAKDPQRGYIYTQSAKTEQIALQPKNPFWMTPKMAQDHEKNLRQMNTKNLPYQLFNPDPNFPGQFPKRENPPVISTALIEEAASRQQEKRNVIGLQEASLGVRSNETSGRAIRERKEPGDAVTFSYLDSLARSIEHTGRVIGGMIPIIYSKQRILNILGMDGKSKMYPVNQKTNINNKEEFIDLTIGKHDIKYISGPGYATQRMEAVSKLIEVMQYAPRVGDVIADVIVDLMNIPGGEKVVNRLKAALPPEIRIAEMTEEGEKIDPSQISGLIQNAIAQGIEQWKQSNEGMQEIEQTKQQVEKTKQEQLQTEQERLKTVAAGGDLKEMVAGLVREIAGIKKEGG